MKEWKEDIMGRLIFVIIFWGIMITAARAAAIDPSLQELCNQAMLQAYQDVLAVKDRYPELAHFDEKSFYENREGIYAIFYETTIPGTNGKPQPYALGLTIESLTAKTFSGKGQVFNFGFPALGLKLSGFQSPAPKHGGFNLNPVIQRNGIPISLEEQLRLPLRLEIRPTQDIFRINEPIEFEVVLRNAGTSNIFVKKLDFDTLYFLINGKPWGTPPSDYKTGGERITLKRGAETRARFKGQSYVKPGIVEIHVMYRMVVRGVNPFATVTVRIKE